MGSFNRVVFSSKSVHWDTPLPIFKELHKEFNFNQDPTHRPLIGPGYVDGLRTKWLLPGGIKSRMYINPSYGTGIIEAWVSKTFTEMYFNRCELAVFLIPLRNSSYFKMLRKRGAEFRLCEKRLKFGDADNSSNNKDNSAPFDSVIAILN